MEHIQGGAFKQCILIWKMSLFKSLWQKLRPALSPSSKLMCITYRSKLMCPWVARVLVSKSTWERSLGSRNISHYWHLWSGPLTYLLHLGFKICHGAFPLQWWPDSLTESQVHCGRSSLLPEGQASSQFLRLNWLGSLGFDYACPKRIKITVKKWKNVFICERRNRARGSSQVKPTCKWGDAAQGRCLYIGLICSTFTGLHFSSGRVSFWYLLFKIIYF